MCSRSPDSSAGKLPRSEAYLSPKKYQEDFQNPWDLDLMDSLPRVAFSLAVHLQKPCVAVLHLLRCFQPGPLWWSSWSSSLIKFNLYGLIQDGAPSRARVQLPYLFLWLN